MTLRPVLVAFLCTLTGCFGAKQVPPTLYFALDPEFTVAAAEATDFTLGIRPLTVARAYPQDVARLEADHLLTYSGVQQWAEKPGDTVTRAITDAIVATGRFSDTGNAADMARPDLILTGELRKFHESRLEAPRKAEVEVRLELREARGPVSLWAKTLYAAIPVEGHAPTALAEAMNQAIAHIAEEAAAAIAAADVSVLEVEEATEAAAPEAQPSAQ